MCFNGKGRKTCVVLLIVDQNPFVSKAGIDMYQPWPLVLNTFDFEQAKEFKSRKATVATVLFFMGEEKKTSFFPLL